MLRRKWILGSLASVFLSTQVIALSAAIKVDGLVTLPGGQPAAGATVHLVYWDPFSSTKIEKTTQTDASGRYVFPDAVADIGTSYFIASKGGYQSKTHKQALGEFDDATVNLPLGSATPIITAPKISTPPTLDGIVSPGEWIDAAVVTPFYKNLETVPYNPNTRGYVMWDAENLYIAIVADEPNTGDIVVNNRPPDDMSIFQDDRGGFYLDPTGFAAFAMGHEVWQVQSNLTSNGLIDGLLRTEPVPMALSPQYNIPGLQVAVNRDDANLRWSMEFKVPLAGVGSVETGMVVPVPTEGSEWRILLTRKRTKAGHSMGSAITLGGYSNATQWMTLRFAGPVGPPEKRGDVNGDGTVDLADVRDALQIAAGLRSGAGAIALGDVADGDAAITITDALTIARSVAGSGPPL